MESREKGLMQSVVGLVGDAGIPAVLDNWEYDRKIAITSHFLDSFCFRFGFH